MSWVNILKKNDKEFETVIDDKEKEVKKVEEKIINYDYKDEDDEFDYKYSYKISCIMVDFDDFLRKEFLPFNDKCVLNKTFNPDYTFFGFIKYNSKEFQKVSNYVNNYNNEINKEIDEENKLLEEEENEISN